MNNSKIKRLIDQAEKLPADGRDVAEIDDLLTDCVAEMLSLRAEIRRLEASSGELEEVVGELRALRNRATAAQPAPGDARASFG
jgi:hypothetical protein